MRSNSLSDDLSPLAVLIHMVCLFWNKMLMVL